MGSEPGDTEDVREYDDRFYVTDVEWFTDESPLEEGEQFDFDTAYTVVERIELDTPVADENAAIGRINGKDVNLSFSDDGLTAILTFTFPETNEESVPADVTAKKVSGFEPGKTYVIVTADGTSLTSMSTPDGRFLEGEPVTIENDAITDGITREMLFTIEESDTENAFYIRGSKGYLDGRKETEHSFSTWGITAAEEPGIRVSYENGKLCVKSPERKSSRGSSHGGMSSPPKYFYMYDGHFNYGDFLEGDDFEIYQVD